MFFLTFSLHYYDGYFLYNALAGFVLNYVANQFFGWEFALLDGFHEVIAIIKYVYRHFGHLRLSLVGPSQSAKLILKRPLEFQIVLRALS